MDHARCLHPHVPSLTSRPPSCSIAPKLLQELVDSNEDVPKKLESETARRDTMEKVSFVDDEKKFMEDLKADGCANEKLRTGIEGFDKDGKTLKDNLREKLSK